MDIIKVVSVGVLGIFVTVLLRENKTDFALLAMIATSVIILVVTLSAFSEAVGAFGQIIAATGIDEGLFSGILKIVGVGYLTEYAANIAEDAGTKSIGTKIQLAGKITVLLLTLPILSGFLSVVKEIIIQ